jgi:hypothetical protein
MPPGGPFLPLAGGTVTGNVSIGADQPNYVTFAGGASGSPAVLGTSGATGDLALYPQYNGSLFVGINRGFPTTNAGMVTFNLGVGGTVASGQQPIIEGHGIQDNANASQASGGGLSWYSMSGSLNAGAVGGRTAFGADLTQSGATTCAFGQYYVAGAFWARASYPAGGTTGSGNARGALFASNDAALLQAGAGANWFAVVGYELDIAAEAGTGIVYKQGMKVTTWATDRVAGSGGTDYAYSIVAQGTCAGWDIGYCLGSPDGWWPMKSAGTLIGTAPALAGGPTYAAAWGIDFNAVTFSGGLLRGQGAIHLGSQTVTARTDLSKHLDIYGGGYGLNVLSSGNMGIAVPTNSAVEFSNGTNFIGNVDHTGLNYMVVGATGPAVGSFTTLNASAGVHCGAQVVSVRTDLTKHLDLYGGQYGMNIMNSGNLAIAFPGSAGVEFSSGTTFVGVVTSTGLNYMPIGATGAAAATFTTIAATSMQSAVSDAAAGAAGVPIGGLYYNVGVVHIRLS